MRKGKEKKGVESAAVCSAQFLNQSLTGFSRCFLSGEHRRGGRGRGAGKNITKPRFDRVILAGCVWKWQGVLPLFTFDAIFARPFRSAHSSSASKASDIFHSFEIVLPSLSQLSNIIVPSINFASAASVSGKTPISLWRARIRYRSSFYLFHLARRFRSIKI